MLQVKNITYTVRTPIGRRTDFAVKDISFELGQGYLMCLLGRNGSGKSTLLRLLYGLFLPDGGEIIWQGSKIGGAKGAIRKTDTASLWQEIAYAGEENLFFTSKSIWENVEMLSRFYTRFCREKFDEYLSQFGLGAGIEEKTVMEVSSGQKRQLQLAFAMARKPKLLLLDEPTAELDPVTRMIFIDMLQELIAEENASVILATHILEDVEEIADYIGALANGKMQLFGDRESILGQSGNLADALLQEKDGQVID